MIFPLDTQQPVEALLKSIWRYEHPAG